MKTIPTFLLSAVVTLSFATVFAGPGGGKGPGHGRMSDDFRGVIHELFASHESFTRTVELTKDGYRAETVSKNADKAAVLKKHVAQMESRLDGGMSVRHWDPAFAELREHYEDMKIEIEQIKGGISVVVAGKTPEAIAVAQNHAKIISGFIEKGSKQMHAEHAAVVTDSKPGDSAAPACGSCGKGQCSGSCGKGKEKGQGKGKVKGGEESASGKGQKPCCAAKAGETKKEKESK